jgi:hypothetical protein
VHPDHSEEQFFEGIRALKESEILNWSLPKYDSVKDLLNYWKIMWIKIQESDAILFTYIMSLRKINEDLIAS